MFIIGHRKKAAAMLLAACLAFSPSAVLARGPDGCAHETGELVPAVMGTCSTPLVDAHYECGLCGVWLRPDGETVTSQASCTHDTDPDHHAASLVKSIGDAAACGQIAETWTCPACGRLYFDREGTQEAEPHVFGQHSMVESKKATCISAAARGGVQCQNCGELFIGSEDISVPAPMPSQELDASNHASRLKHVDAKAATSISPGWAEYWTCTDCGAVFSDSEGASPAEYKDLAQPWTPSDEKHAVLRVMSGEYLRQTGQIVFHTVIAGLHGEAVLDAQLLYADGTPVTDSAQKIPAASTDGAPLQTDIIFDTDEISGKEVTLNVLADASDISFLNVTEDPAPSVAVPPQPEPPAIRTSQAVQENDSSVAAVKARCSNLVQGEKYTIRCTIGEASDHLEKSFTFTAQAPECEKSLDFDMKGFWGGRTFSVHTELLDADGTLLGEAAGELSVPAHSPKDIRARNAEITAVTEDDGTASVTCRVQVDGLPDEIGIRGQLTDSRTGSALDAAPMSYSFADGDTVTLIFKGVEPEKYRGIPIGAVLILEQDVFRHAESLPDMKPVFLEQEEPVVTVETLTRNENTLLVNAHMFGLEESVACTLSARLTDAKTGESVPGAEQADKQFVPDGSTADETVELVLPESAEGTLGVRLQLVCEDGTVAGTDDNAGGSFAPGVPVITAERAGGEHAQEDAKGNTLRVGETETETLGTITVFSESVTYSLADPLKNCVLCAVLIDDKSGWPVLQDREPVITCAELNDEGEGTAQLRVSVPTSLIREITPHLKTTLLIKGRAAADTRGGTEHVPALEAKGVSVKQTKDSGRRLLIVSCDYSGLEPGLTYMLTGEIVTKQSGADEKILIARPIQALTDSGSSELSFTIPGGASISEDARIKLKLSYDDHVLAEEQADADPNPQ